MEALPSLTLRESLLDKPESISLKEGTSTAGSSPAAVSLILWFVAR